jgi:hypothetical protein
MVAKTTAGSSVVAAAHPDFRAVVAIVVSLWQALATGLDDEGEQ